MHRAGNVGVCVCASRENREYRCRLSRRAKGDLCGGRIDGLEVLNYGIVARSVMNIDGPPGEKCECGWCEAKSRGTRLRKSRDLSGDCCWMAWEVYDGLYSE